MQDEHFKFLNTIESEIIYYLIWWCVLDIFILFSDSRLNCSCIRYNVIWSTNMCVCVHFVHCERDYVCILMNGLTFNTGRFVGCLLKQRQHSAPLASLVLLSHFQQYFSYISAVSFIGTRRKTTTCH